MDQIFSPKPCVYKSPPVDYSLEGISGDAWLAEFVAGDLAGTKVTSHVRGGLSQTKWDSINGDSRFGITLAKASFKHKKNAVWEYICAACKQMLDKRVAEDASSSSAAPSS